MSKHTKGDWTFDGFGVNVNGARIASLAPRPQVPIGVAPNNAWRTIGESEQQANGRLLAQADNLLVALRDMVRASESRWRGLPIDSFEKRSLNRARLFINAAVEE